MMSEVRNILKASRRRKTTKNKSEAEPCMSKTDPTTKALEHDEKNWMSQTFKPKRTSSQSKNKKNKADTEAMEHEHGQK